ncbi:hypothetical protein [Qipengyuania sp.]|uniref:hypothetical protein n=1 Tax=Qipengyuania sp. TaxID=2004515 RepID=UPI003AF9D749
MGTRLVIFLSSLSLSTIAHADPIPAEQVAAQYPAVSYGDQPMDDSKVTTFACIYYGKRGEPTYEGFGPLYAATGHLPYSEYAPKAFWTEWVRETYSLTNRDFVSTCNVYRGDLDKGLAAAKKWVRNYSDFENIMAEEFELDWSISRPAFQRWLDVRNGTARDGHPEDGESPRSQGGEPIDKDDRPQEVEQASQGREAADDREEAAKLEQARIEAERLARAEAERKSEEAVDALYAEQVRQTEEYLRKEREKIETIERQQREAQARAEMFERQLANQRRIDAEYRASVARHNKCVAGDEKACEAIRQNAPLAVDEKAEQASTDQRATLCVSAPVVSPSSTFKGQTQAVVVNGCEKPVDVRICLLREGGWNCGVNWGVAPQDRMAHTSFNASGEVYWDARYTGTTKALGNPQ